MEQGSVCMINRFQGNMLRSAADQWLSARGTRWESLEMPLGNLTFHWLWLASTFKRIVASQGAWFSGDSTSTKSSPMWVISRDVPLIKRRISTWAECAP